MAQMDVVVSQTDKTLREWEMFTLLSPEDKGSFTINFNPFPNKNL